MNKFSCENCVLNKTDACRYGINKKHDYSDYCNDLLVDQDEAFKIGYQVAQKEFKKERVTLIQEIHDLVFQQGKEIAIKPILQHIKDNNYNSPLAQWIEEYSEGILKNE